MDRDNWPDKTLILSGFFINNRRMKMNVKKQFMKYVSLNILGMIGLSCYILADSYFISKAQGANGLTALNLVLPLYNMIFAIGAMIGVGSAIRYSVGKSKGDVDSERYVWNAIVWNGIIGVIFILIGLFLAEPLLRMLGADDEIVKVGVPYTRIFMMFAPMFMWNLTANAYVRNDNAPHIAMIATLSSSLFNIVFDYVLMFPLGLGMRGAALATALSPVIGIAICMTHLLSKKSSVKVKVCMISVKKLVMSCQVGVSAFVAEISSGVITLVFNYIILTLTGNVGVAAYGVVANVALVVVAVFNGIAQGSQPLISSSYGKGDEKDVKILRNMSLITGFVCAIILYTFLYVCTDNVVAIFNGENDIMLAKYAHEGVRIYFIGIFFSGLNIIGSSFFSAVERVRGAFIVSMLRGFVLIILSAFIMSVLLKMTGIWMAYAVAEAITCVIMFAFMREKKKN